MTELPALGHNKFSFPGKARVWGLAVLFLAAASFLAVEAVEVKNVRLGKFKSRGSGGKNSGFWEIEGAEAVMNGRVVTLSAARLVFTMDDGREAVVTSPQCRFDDGDKSVRSSDEIHVRHPAFSLDGVGFTVYSPEQRLVVHSKVKMTLRQEAMGGMSIFTPLPAPSPQKPSGNEKESGVNSTGEKSVE